MQDLFPPGSPLRPRRTGSGRYELSVTIPNDADGFRGQECPAAACAPGYFKVKPGTGLTGQDQSYCPYCRKTAAPNEFFTAEQIRYAKDLVAREATHGVSAMMRGALGLDSSGRKKIDGGLFSLEISMQEPREKPVFPPFDEELRRDVRCPACTLEHAVFGLATWCPDCGEDVFLIHVAAEADVVRRMLGAIPDRRAALGARVAARDLENALEDVVSIFEAVLKVTARRGLLSKGVAESEVEATLAKRTGTAFQNPGRAAAVYRDLFGKELFACLTSEEAAELEAAFAKRHPITHNLGIVDRKYLERARAGTPEGRDVRVSVDEVDRALAYAVRVLQASYLDLFPAAKTGLSPAAPGQQPSALF